MQTVGNSTKLNRKRNINYAEFLPVVLRSKQNAWHDTQVLHMRDEQLAEGRAQHLYNKYDVSS